MEFVLDRTNEESLRDVLFENLLYIAQRAEPRDILIYLRQAHVLSNEEVEEILNRHIHVTRQHSATQMVDVVTRKGVSGMNKFLDVLEHKYPHIFTRITLQEAQKEPADWLKSYGVELDTGSLTSSTVRKLLSGFEQDFMTWQKERRPKYCANNATSQSGNTDELYDLFVELEKENDSLRRYIAELEHDNVKFIKQQRMHLWKKDKHTQQLEKHLERAKAENETLSTKLNELKTQLASPDANQVSVRGHIKNKLVKDAMEYMEQLEMKNTQVETKIKELEESCSTYKTLLNELRKEKDDLQTAHEKLWKLNFETDKLAELTREQTRYYEREVSSLRNELLMLRSSSVKTRTIKHNQKTAGGHRVGYVGPSNTSEGAAADAVANAAADAEADATVADDVEEAVDENGLPVTKMRRANLRNYPQLQLRRYKKGRNADGNSSDLPRRYAPDKPWSRFYSYVELSAPEIADEGKVETIVMRQDAVDSMLEPHIMRRAFLNKVPDSNADVDPKSLSSLKINREQTLIEVTISVADLKEGGRVTLIGGNYSGIFVHKVHKQLGAVVEESDQLLLIKWDDEGVEKRLSLDSITMEDLVTALTHMSGNVRVSRLPNAIGYKYLMQQKSSSDMYNGDFFCAMFHNSKRHKVLDLEFDVLKPSNVLLVMNSRHRGEDIWYGEVLNPATGGKRAHGVFTSFKLLQAGGDGGSETGGSKRSSDAHQRDSNSSQASTSSASSSSEGPSSAAPLFDYVTPYRAKAKRPVVIYCESDCAADIMRELLELSLFLAAEYSYKSDNLDQGEVNYSPLEISQRIRNRQILHYEGNADNFVCLLTRRFVDLILNQKEKHVLLNVPVVCIRRMYAVGIYPIVFVIKSDQMTGSLAEEEELQENHNSHQYETIYYSDGTNMREVARIVEQATLDYQQHLIWRQCDGATSP